MQSNKQEIADHLERASAILDEAERAKRRLTNSERKSVEGHLERVEEVKEQEVLRNEIERMNAGGGVPGGGDFAQAVVSAGFNLKSNPSVTIPLRTALGKAPTLPAVGDWNRAAPEVVAMGRDARFLNANLVQESVGGESAIQDFRQSARTVTGSPQRALDCTDPK
jgi:hypothetical protein